MKKGIYVLLLLMLTFTLAGCSKKEKNDTTENGVVEDVIDEADYLKKEDALNLAQEKMADTGYEIAYYDHISEGVEGYFLFSLQKDQKDLTDQMLAISDVSGDAYIFDNVTEEIKPFEDFTGYDKERDEEVEWSGTFEKGDLQMRLEPEEPTCSYVTVTENKEVKTEGTLNVEQREGSLMLEDEKLAFHMADNKLEVKSDKADSPYAGEWTAK